MPINENYTLDNFTLPSQAASKKDFEMLASIGS